MASINRSRYRIVHLGGNAPEGIPACYEFVGVIDVGGTTGPLVRRASGHFYQKRGDDFWRLTDRKVEGALQHKG